MYLAQRTRYNILYAVNQLARAMSKPVKAHMGAVKHCFATWSGLQAERLQACCLLGCQLGQQSRQRQVYVIIHRDAGQHLDQLQGGTAGADRTVHDGGRARSGSSDNEGGGVLLRHYVEAGLRQRVAVHLHTSALYVGGSRT